MVVVRGEENFPKITYQLGPSLPSEDEDIEVNEAFFEGKLFHKDILKDDNIWFYRYEIKLPMSNYEQMVKYAVDGTMEPHYRFFVPSFTQNSNVISYSCNGFSLSVDTSKFKGSLWYDVLKSIDTFIIMPFSAAEIKFTPIILNCMCQILKLGWRQRTQLRSIILRPLKKQKSRLGSFI